MSDDWKAPDTVTLLTGGNPQIPKGFGAAPVAAYIAAMPGWKSALGARLDALIGLAVPGVCKAVKWNTPLYGMEQGRWFTAFSCTTRYVKVAFFDGAALTPPPPEASRQPKVRYLHIFEDGTLDQDQLADWIRQASRLPGERL